MMAATTAAINKFSTDCADNRITPTTHKIAYGNHESGVRIHLTSESDELSANQKGLERAPERPASIRGYPINQH